MRDRRHKGRRRSRPAILLAGLGILLVMVILASVAPEIWSRAAGVPSPDLNGAASWTHPLGTDAIGRDLLDRALVATRLSMTMAALSTMTAVVLGLALGAGIVLLRRRARLLGERTIDLLVAFPPIIVSLAIIAVYRPSETSVVLAVGIAFTPQFARLTNTLAASVKSRDYVTVAQLIGVRPLRLLARHIVPNLIGPLLVLTSIGFASAIIAISGLSFIGVGIQQPQYDWGALLSQGLQQLNTNPVEVVGPAVAILLTGLAAGLVGDGLNQYLNPRFVRRPARSQASPTAKSAPMAVTAAVDELGPSGLGRPGRADRRDAAVRVQDLRVDVGGTPIVRGLSLFLREGEILGIVGESGSGKSVTAMALARLLPSSLTWSAQSLSIFDTDLSDPERIPPRSLATEVGVVFQDPASCFNPARRVGAQITEVARVHGGLGRREAYALAVKRLREVQISTPERRMRQYPHELSGGMRQRAMIAMALVSSSRFLIADEPTTALDVTTQADLLRLLKRLTEQHRMTTLLISHDISVVSAICDRVCVMYAGRVVEEVAAADLAAGRVLHPYTRALVRAAPDWESTSRAAELVPLPGRPPGPDENVIGCSFAPRCQMAVPECHVCAPELEPVSPGRMVACHMVRTETNLVRE